MTSGRADGSALDGVSSDTGELGGIRVALRHLPFLARMVWDTHPGLTLATILLRVIRGCVPLAILHVGKLIINGVISASRGTPIRHNIWELLLIELAIVVTGEILARLSSLSESLLGDLFSNSTSIQLMQHAAQLDLAKFEDPRFYDHLERARRQTVGRIALLGQIASIGQDIVTITSLAALLVMNYPVLLALLVVALIPSFIGETHYATLGYSLLFRLTPERRQLDNYRYIGASDRTAKEVQIYGLAS